MDRLRFISLATEELGSDCCDRSKRPRTNTGETFQRPHNRITFCSLFASEVAPSLAFKGKVKRLTETDKENSTLPLFLSTFQNISSVTARWRSTKGKLQDLTSLQVAAGNCMYEALKDQPLLGELLLRSRPLVGKKVDTSKKGE